MLKPNTRYKIVLGESVLGTEKGFALLKYHGKPSDRKLGIDYEKEYKVEIEEEDDNNERVTVIHHPNATFQGKR